MGSDGGPASDATKSRLRDIIHRDLKLDPGIEIAEDTALFGGELDLDSLDALLLLQSIEREFGVVAPAEAVSPETFQNLTSLADFVHSLQDRQKA